MPFYRNDVRGGLIQPGPGPVARPERAWHVDIGATHWAPILVGGLIVVGTSAGEVIALDGRTGERRWAFQAAHPFTTGSFNGSAAASGGMVFVSDTSTTYALDATTGAQRWAAQTPTKGSRPLVVDGVVYVGTVDGAVGLAQATGAEVWRRRDPRMSRPPWAPSWTASHSSRRDQTGGDTRSTSTTAPSAGTSRRSPSRWVRRKSSAIRCTSARTRQGFAAGRPDLCS